MQDARGFCRAVKKRLKDDGVTKHIKLNKRADDTQYIDVLYTDEDVDKVFRAMLSVMIELISNGDGVTVKNFLTIYPAYKKARSITHIKSGEQIVIPGGYAPKAKFGEAMKSAASNYGKLSCADDGTDEYMSVEDMLKELL